jgi:predicted small lipoprotein YifL
MIRIAALLFTVIMLTAALSACGRKGPLEAPSASANPAAQSGPAQPAPVEDTPFILDGLIQ